MLRFRNTIVLCVKISPRRSAFSVLQKGAAYCAPEISIVSEFPVLFSPACTPLACSCV